MKLLPPGILLLLASTLPIFAGEMQTVQFTVDAARGSRPISRFIYGVNLSLDAPYSFRDRGSDMLPGWRAPAADIQRPSGRPSRHRAASQPEGEAGESTPALR